MKYNIGEYGVGLLPFFNKKLIAIISRPQLGN
jgi:hypothetical protein